MYVYRAELQKGKKTNLHQTWHDYALDQREIFELSELRKIVLSSSPDECGSFISERKHSIKATPRPKLFRIRDYRIRGHIPEELVGLSPDEYIGFKDSVFLCIVGYYRMIRPMIRFRAVKDDKRCKNLSNFLAVTLVACC